MSNTAETLFHLQALISQCLSDAASNLKKRNEIDPGSIVTSCNISRFIGEDIFSTPVDQTNFDSEVAVDTKQSAGFSFAVQLRCENQIWTLGADISEIEQYGGTVRSTSPKASSPNLTEIVSAAEPACDWLIARAADFDFKTRAF